MTQHSLEFDPNTKEKEREFDSLSDTWSRADALLEELPRARARKEPRQVADEPLATGKTGDEKPGSGSESESGSDALEQSPGAPRQGLLRK